MKNILILMLVAFTGLVAHAGHDGNGGDGILIGNRVYCYDLVEHGLQNMPYFNKGLVVPDKITKLVEANFYNYSSNVKNLISLKLAEVQLVDDVFYSDLEMSINSFQWDVLNDFSLVDIDDEDGSDVEIPKALFKQVAVRNLGAIKMNGQILKQMDDENIAAIIFHEIIYAIIPLEAVDTEILDEHSVVKTVRGYHQSSPQARQLNAYIFTEGFSKKGLDSLAKVVPDGIPVGVYKNAQTFSIANGFAYNVSLRTRSLDVQFTPFEADKFKEFTNQKCVEGWGANEESFVVDRVLVTSRILTYVSYYQKSQVQMSYLKLNMDFGILTRKNVGSYYPVTGGFWGDKLLKDKSTKKCLSEFAKAWSAYTGDIK